MRLLILSLMLSPLLGAAPIKKDDALNVLDKKVPLVIFSNEDEFFRLCWTLRIPCGEEMLPNENLIQTDDYGVRQEGVSVRVLLDKMLKRRPGFLWEVSDGVLVLRPRSPTVSSPLGRHVRIFVRKDQEAWTIINELAHSEWIDIGEPAPYVGAGVSVETLMAAKKTLIGVECADSTVRQILNTIVRTHGHSMWTYTYPPPSGFIRNYFHRGKLESFEF